MAIETTTPATSTSATRLERPFYLRLCASRIGVGYGNPDASVAILDVGPVSFLALDLNETASMAESAFAPDSEGRYGAFKYVTVVDGSALGPVILLLDPSISDPGAGLVYDPALWDQGTLGAADRTVRFEVCPDVDAQFNGGFLITKPMCFRFAVIEWGHYPPLISFGAIPFGVPLESCQLPDLDAAMTSFGRLDCSPGVVLQEDVADSGADPDALVQNASAEVVTVVHEPPSFWWGYDQNGRVIAAVALEDVTPLSYEVFTCEEQAP